MKLLERKNSLETCTEAGWRAYDYFLDEPMDTEFIRRFQPLGSFLFMPMLKEPFFKVESDFFVVKGVQNRSVFRVAVHMAHEALLETIEAQVGLGI